MENRDERCICFRMLVIVVGIVGIVVTVISIIVTIISILQAASKNKHEKSNRPSQG